MGDAEQIEEIGARPHFVLPGPDCHMVTLSSSRRRAYWLYESRLSGQTEKNSVRSAVGTVIADRPPPKSVQAEFPHTAPTLGA